MKFAISFNPSSVGQSVYTLGYPLIRTMGDNMKLTPGTVSSLTGYRADVTTYQLDMQVQSGNSGGPLFDSKGQLVGLIKAKHAEASNATYAIKIRMIANLLDGLPEPLSLATQSSLDKLSLPEQEKVLRNYVFLVKALE